MPYSMKIFTLTLALKISLISCKQAESGASVSTTDMQFHKREKLVCKKIDPKKGKFRKSFLSFAAKSSAAFKVDHKKYYDSGKLAEELIQTYTENYYPCNAKFKLSVDQSKQILHEAYVNDTGMDLRKAEVFQIKENGLHVKLGTFKKFLSLFQEQGEQKYENIYFLTHGSSFWWTLNKFSFQTYPGGTLERVKKGWTIKTKAKIFDVWNYNRESENALASPREFLTTLGSKTIYGNPFPIESEVLCIEQRHDAFKIDIKNC